jgi:type VI secretion system protein ImpM
VSSRPPAPGWFGKLSSLGDFAQRRLAPPWVQGCDAWLSQGMAALQQRGPQWLPQYLAAPVWRFAWGPGVAPGDAAPQWWFGVLMPSCDSVGRYFPLLVAQPRTAAPDDRFGWAHLDLWWQQLVQASLRTLADGASLERFEAELAGLPPWPVPGGGALLQRVPGSERWRSAPAAGAGDVAQALAGDALRERLAGHSLWWACRSDGSAGDCVLAQGLPSPAQFAALMQPA